MKIIPFIFSFAPSCFIISVFLQDLIACSRAANEHTMKTAMTDGWRKFVEEKEAPALVVSFVRGLSACLPLCLRNFLLRKQISNIIGAGRSSGTSVHVFVSLLIYTVLLACVIVCVCLFLGFSLPRALFVVTPLKPT